MTRLTEQELNERYGEDLSPQELDAMNRPTFDDYTEEDFEALSRMGLRPPRLYQSRDFSGFDRIKRLHESRQS